MTITDVTSATQTVRIGPSQPFIIIGERINPTGRRMLASEMAAGNFDRVQADAIAQVKAGAHMLDVNAGIPMADEPALLAEAVRVVQSTVDVPLCIDSSVVAALKAGLEAYQGKPLVNSVTAEDERLEAVLPLVAEHGAAVIGIVNDESGISEDPEVRFAMAEKIVARAEQYGIPREDVLIDPLVMPVGAIPRSARVVFDMIDRLTNDLGVNSICGASNISFGLPNREALNAAFLAMAIGAGLPAAITNPLEGQIRDTVLAADVLMARDENCEAWLVAQRQGKDGARRRRRRVQRP